MSDAPTLPALPPPSSQRVIRAPPPWLITLHERRVGLRQADVIWSKGYHEGVIPVGAWLARPGWDPRDPDDADAVWALLEAGVLQNSAWLTDPEAPTALADNRALRAMRAALAEVHLSPRMHLYCPQCVGYAWATRLVCDHFAAPARAVLDAVRADPALRLQAAGLVEWYGPSDSGPLGCWGIASAAALLRGRLDPRPSRTASVLDVGRPARTAAPDPVRLASLAWGVAEPAEAPRTSSETIVLDLDAPTSERFDVRVVLPKRA